MSVPNSGLNMSRRIRRTPYTDKVEEAGGCGFWDCGQAVLVETSDGQIREGAVRVLPFR